jgi:hypothetical protein
MHLLLLHIDEQLDERLPSREVNLIVPECFDPPMRLTERVGMLLPMKESD